MRLWVYTSLQVYEEFDIYRESRPLKMKFFDWRLWISEDFESEEIGVNLKTRYSFKEYEAWRLLFS